MPTAGAEERAWAASKREFVADSRDDEAEERDIAADARDAIADARDAIADAREAELARREERLRASLRDGSAGEEAPAATPEDGDARAARSRAGEDRADLDRERHVEKVHRDQATERRLTDGRPTNLALAFASIAEQLYDAHTYDEVLTRIAEAAVATVTGGETASVTLREGGKYRTAGSTGPAATAADQAQFDAEEGPSLDAFTMPLVDVPSFPDARWPVLGSHPNDLGVQSSISYHLNTSGDEGAEAGIGTLNIYASTPAAFDQAAQEIGSILAAHASLAARALGERITLEGLGEHLRQALLSRDVIGQAKGILMERLKTTPEDAFDILKASSQRLNLKLREVARKLAETGEVDTDDLKQA
jgi:hypothetical protein